MSSENQDRRVIRYGIDLNTIPKEEPECKSIIPVSNPTPSKPRSYGASFFAQPVLVAPPKPLLLEDAPPKGPIVKVPEGTKILPPKRDEVLVGVKTNKKGEIVSATYKTGERTHIEGVRAHPTKVKFIPLKEAPKGALAASETPRKHRKTMADLEKELEDQRAIIASLESCQRLQGRCALRTDSRVLDIEEILGIRSKKGKAQEHPKK